MESPSPKPAFLSLLGVKGMNIFAAPHGGNPPQWSSTSMTLFTQRVGVQDHYGISLGVFEGVLQQIGQRRMKQAPVG